MENHCKIIITTELVIKINTNEFHIWEQITIHFYLLAKYQINNDKFKSQPRLKEYLNLKYGMNKLK